MSNYSLKSKFLIESSKRGFINQATDLEGLDQIMTDNPIVAYLGFDATSNSLHIGSLLQIMWIRLLQKTGNKPIILIGGATTKIGDPSDKNSIRKLICNKKIDENVKAISNLLKKYITFGNAQTDAILVNNKDWLSKLNYIELLEKTGKHFTINRMLTFDSVKRRLNRKQPLTFLEFNYMILQAIDFVELNKRFKCKLQIAGADQWGNIVSGIDLNRRINGIKTFGITTPLITKANQAKMGKTTKGTVWLNKNNFPVFDFWQYWRNTPDENVIKYLKLFTEINIEEINKLSKLKGKEINEAKKILANSVTNMIHGEKSTIESEQRAKEIFYNTNGNLTKLPIININKTDININTNILYILKYCQITKSNNEGRKLIRSGILKINNEQNLQENKKITIKDFNNNIINISIGKKKNIQINLIDT